MGTGFPGTGLATIFYVLSVLVMPLVQAVRSVRTRSWGPAGTWPRMLRHLLLAAGMAVALVGTVLVLPDVDLPPSPIRTRAATYLGTGAVFVLLVVLSLFPLRALVRRGAQLAAVAGVVLLVGLVVDQPRGGVPEPVRAAVTPAPEQAAAPAVPGAASPAALEARLAELRQRFSMSLDLEERRELAREYAALVGTGG